MPTLNVTTNVPTSKVEASDLIKTFSPLIAKETGKSERYVVVSVRGDVPMSFGGTEDPCAYVELISIGGLNTEKNKQISASICSVLELKLQIPKTRVYIKFFDVERAFFGYNGGTFA